MVPPRRKVTLRVTLVTLTVGLLLTTVGAISAVAFINTRTALEALAALHFTTVAGATSRIEYLTLERAQSLLEELAAQARRGLLPVDAPDTLGLYLAERLRYQPDLAWISYSDQATGRFVGVWRREDGAIVLNRSQPDRDDGRPTEAVVAPDGSLTPFQREVPSGYDPRERPWYQEAITQPRVIWTQPYVFQEGRAGLTAALALRDPTTGQPRGVFTVDFFLDDISRFLASLSIGQTGRAFVLTRAGRVVASPVVGAGDTPDPVLAAALQALPRPLAQLTLDHPFSLTFAYSGERYVGVFQATALKEDLEWVTAIVVPEIEFLGLALQNMRVAGGIGLVALALAVVLAYLLANRVASPLRTMAHDLEQVGQFKLSPAPMPPSFIKEIDIVSDSVDRMKASLRSFSRYVPADLVREVLASGQEARLGGQLRQLSIHFSDIEGFTALSERLSPAEVVQALAEYLEIMTAILREHRGTLDKFMGDGILAFFNAPHEVPGHAALACRAALRARERLAARAATGRLPFRARIGLHIGEVLVGNIGTPERFAYTIIGDAVNLASRLEALNKSYGTTILASEALRAAAGPGFEWRRLDRVAVVGRTESTLVNELLGEQGAVAPAVLAARDIYEQALAAYFARQFTEAAAGFRAAAGQLPGDRAAALMLRRAELLAEYPPPPDWSGVHPQTVK
jgi:adenylate cyclase